MLNFMNNLVISLKYYASNLFLKQVQFLVLNKLIYKPHENFVTFKFLRLRSYIGVSNVSLTISSLIKPFLFESEHKMFLSIPQSWIRNTTGKVSQVVFKSFLFMGWLKTKQNKYFSLAYLCYLVEVANNMWDLNNFYSWYSWLCRWLMFKGSWVQITPVD